MDLKQVLRTLWSHWRTVLVMTLLGAGLGAAASLVTQPEYRATSQLFVSVNESDGSNAGLNQAGQFAQQRVKSYADVINSPKFTGAVVEELGLRMSPRDLAERVDATVPLDTVLIDVDVTSTSPSDAQRIADALARRSTSVLPDLERSQATGDSPVKVSVVRDAELPLTPVKPRTAVYIVVGLLLGVALGTAVALLRDLLDTSIKDAETLTTTTGLAALGVISHDSDSSKQPLIVHADPHSRRAEAFRQLRTNLQFLDVDKPPRSILVTSSMPGEGKSTTTCNLALALTQAGLRVVVVDGDLRKPKLAEYLGLVGSVGLTDVLVGRAGLDDVLQTWGTGPLLVLPSGHTPPNPSELLGSQHMRALVRELESRADLVLIDAPPLLPVADAAVLANLVSGAAMVVRAGRTTREQLTRATENLRKVDANIYGAILNMASTRGPDAYTYGEYAATAPSQRTSAADAGLRSPHAALTRV